MSRTRLPPSALQQQLQRLNAGATTAWTIEHDKLHKTFVFKNFVQAFGFMTQVALEAEKIDHHPDWCNVYKTVVVDLHTHDAGGITALDFTLAAQIDKLA